MSVGGLARTGAHPCGLFRQSAHLPGNFYGNLLKRPLTEIMDDYDADDHPIVGPLLAGGPAEIVRRYGLAHEAGYADHCHLCYTSRCALRQRFPDVLTPDQMYGMS